MIEDRTREVFLANEDLRATNDQLSRDTSCSQAYESELEQSHPGITHVDRSTDGFVRIDMPSDEELEALIGEHQCAGGSTGSVPPDSRS